jgi:hypothetical protein
MKLRRVWVLNGVENISSLSLYSGPEKELKKGLKMGLTKHLQFAG